jgi:hypothetical protein
MRAPTQLLLFAMGLPGCLLADYEKIEATTPAPQPATVDCCQAEPGGCRDVSIAACVCGVDAYCCESDWDESCGSQVAAFGCGGCGDRPGTKAPEVSDCAVDADCGPAAPLCVHGLCAQCRDDAGCSARDPALPICGSEGFCGECESSAQCGIALPLCRLGLCAQCIADSDCGDGTACVEGTCA